MECFVPPRRARRSLLCLSFGAIVLWIALGSYMRREDSEETAGGGRGGVANRHLLSISERDLGGKSCEALNMTYSNNKTVDLTNDEVKNDPW